MDFLKLYVFLFGIYISGTLIAQDKNSFERIVTINNSPWAVDFADLNGDQIQDMVGVYGNSNANIEIYYGKSDGSFKLETTLNAGTGEYYYVLLANLNADNVPDIIAYSNINQAIFLSGLSGYVQAGGPPTGDFFNTLLGDFNNDGALDLFSNNQLLINDKHGVFTYGSYIGGNGGAVATDFNNDHLLDLVMTNPGNGTVAFYQGNGDGTFQPALVKTVTADEVISYDLNTDGFVDIIAKGYNGELIVFYNDNTFSFSQSSILQLGHNYYSVVQVFDIDQDGTADLVTSNDSDVQYRPIMPNGSFGTESIFKVGLSTLRGLIVKDAIGESFPDMVVMSGFGITKIYSDKLNAAIQFSATTKTYDALPFTNFYQVTPAVNSTTVTYPQQLSPPKDVGTFDVTVSVVDPNYEGELKGTISITKNTLTVDVNDVTAIQGSPIPPFVLVYAGFAGSDNQSMLTQQPTASTTATSSSAPGDYEITISGGIDKNYVFDYKTGVLTIAKVTGVVENVQNNISPNPAKDRLHINVSEWTSLKISDLVGRDFITRTYTDEEISLQGCQSGIYALQLILKDGNKIVQRLIIE